MRNWENIKILSRMESHENIIQFEECLSEIAKEKNTDDLNKLLNLFNDECEYPEIMYSLLHTIESYPDEFYVKTILKNISDGLKFYPEWFERIVNRILNEDNCRKIFCEFINIAEKNDLINLFDIMEKESPHHHDLIEILRNKIE